MTPGNWMASHGKMAKWPSFVLGELSATQRLACRTTAARALIGRPHGRISDRHENRTAPRFAATRRPPRRSTPLCFVLGSQNSTLLPFSRLDNAFWNENTIDTDKVKKKKEKLEKRQDLDSVDFFLLPFCLGFSPDLIRFSLQPTYSLVTHS